MKNLFRYIKHTTTKLVMALFLVACSSEFLDINVDPNNPATASLDLLLPSAQASAAFQTSRTVNEHASIFVQHFYGLAPSQYNLNGSNYSNDFNGIYSQALKDLQTIVDQGTPAGVKGYVGIAKVMKAYLFMVTVDIWGDVPYTEALKGETIKSPKYDDDGFIYDQLLLLLAEAKTDLNDAITANEPKINSDLVYGSAANATTQFTRWIKAANTIMLRLYLNISKVDKTRATTEINALITENNFISSNAEDFQMVYGNTQAPLTRHPIFQQEYGGAGKAFYITNYFMYYMILKNDPRLPFYVFRQGTDAQVDFQTRPCRNRPDCVYGWLSTDPQTKGLTALNAAANGYIGRDHGDPSGIPNDNAIRATFGVYPIGGSYDRGPGGGSRTLASNATGAGIMPWMTNFMRLFMLAESALTLGTPGSPRQLMLDGIDASIQKVDVMGRANDGAAIAITTAVRDAYKNARGTDYDNATTDDERLNVIITEKYYSNFGNGIEAYTDYRRTGKPSNLPAALAPQGPTPIRLLLPPGELSTNSNAPNPPPLVTDPIFWDN